MIMLLVRVREQQLAVVGDQVATIAQITPGAIEVQYNGRNVPVIDLAAALDMPPAASNGCTALVRSDAAISFAVDAVVELLDNVPKGALQPLPILLRETGLGVMVWGLLNMWMVKEEEKVVPVLNLARSV